MAKIEELKREGYLKENKDYYDMLDNVDARQEFFSKLTSTDPNDHSEVNKVKNKINKLI